MNRFETRLRAMDPSVRELIGRIPLQADSPLPPEWLRCEMLERLEVVGRAPEMTGRTVLEVGSGAHALSTVPLALRAGPGGRVVALERSRWSHFRPVVAASGLGERVRPVAGDAGTLPLRADAVELAACIHGIRSLGSDRQIVRIFREMLRVSPRLFLAESLTIARTNAEAAHLAMYDLREEVLSAVGGTPDDLHYRPLDRLVSLAETAGGIVERAETREIDLPHFLGYFPRTLAEAIPRGIRREDLLRRWDDANELRRRHGEDHPPVGIVTASRP